jgi:hydrogenase/urease accessory protein HupE
MREALAAADTFVMLPHADTPGVGYRYLIIAQEYRLPRSDGPISLAADWLDGAKAGELLTVRATRGQDVDLLILSPDRNEGALFLNAWQTLLRYAPVGMAHILLGLDHLLFLLTVVVAGTSLRYWFTVVTSFTLAHSVTLTLSALGVVTWPASMVEPLIALSIVLMGADNLLRRQVSTAQRAAFVFGCGLLHGMSFAGAVGQAGLSTSHRLASIAGFNLGIELGQATFLIGLFGLALAAKRLLGATRPVPTRKLASVSAVLLGLGMLGARLVG